MVRYQSYGCPASAKRNIIQDSDELISCKALAINYPESFSRNKSVKACEDRFGPGNEVAHLI